MYDAIYNAIVFTSVLFQSGFYMLPSVAFTEYLENWLIDKVGV